MMYHYTTIDVLDKIILDTENRSEQMCLLATDFEYLNDPDEIYHGLQVLCSYLPIVEDELEINPNERIAERMKEFIVNIKQETVFRDYGYCVYNSLFLTSFSAKKDCLSMWNMYAGNGGGINLELTLPLGINDYRLRNVIYDDNEVEVINTLKGAYQRAGLNNKNHTLSDITKALMRYIAMRIKSHNYSFEEEWRLCNAVFRGKEESGKDIQIKFRVKNGVMIPYHEIKFDSCFLRSIIVGPTRNYEQSKKSIEMFLASRGLHHVNVVPSTIKYRG